MSISTDPDKYQDDPVETMLEEYRNRSPADEGSVSDLTLEKYENDWGLYKRFMEAEYPNIHLLEANQEHLKAFRDHLLEDRTENTVYNKLRCLSVFYSRLLDEGAVQANPASYVLKRSNLNSESPERPDISLDEMRRFVGDIRNPFWDALIMTLLKFGPRIGETANIDLQCVNLDHEGYRQLLDDYGITLHDEVADKPDTIYIYPDIDVGEVVNEDKRVNTANKRKMATIVPVDDELKQSLLRWLAVRPETPKLPAQPLFVTNFGGRYSHTGLSNAVNTAIEEIRPEWREGEGLSENVVSHYFRHYFGTLHREGYDRYHDGSLADPKLKYIRGDVPEDDEILNVYSQEWGLEIRDSYLDNIYKVT